MKQRGRCISWCTSQEYGAFHSVCQSKPFGDAGVDLLTLVWQI